MWPLSSADKKNTFFGGAAILTVGVILVKLIGAIYKIPLGNILSDEAYSDFTSAYNIYNLFLTISTAGLPVALSKTVSEADTLGRRNQIQRTFRVALLTFTVLGTLSFIAMSVFAQPLATASGNEAAVYCIMGLSPSVFCVCVMSAFRGYAQGHSNMIPTTVSQIIEAFFKMVAGLILAVLILRFATGTEEFRQQMAAAGAIVGVSIGSVVALVYLVFSYLRHRRRQRPSQDVPESSRDIFIHLLRLAIPITLGSAAMNLVTLIDTKVVLELLQKMYHDLPELITPEAVTQAETTAGVSAELFMARGLKGIYDKCMAVYNLPAALIDSLYLEQDIAKAAGVTDLLVTPGNYGDSFAEGTLDLDLTHRCTCSNYLGHAIDHAAGLGFRSFLLVGHLGKLIKVAAGNMNTHSKVADGRRETLTAHAALAGGSPALLKALFACPTTDAGVELLKEDGLLEPVMASIAQALEEVLHHRAGPDLAIEAVFFSNQYGLLGKTTGAENLLALHQHQS